MQSIKLMQYLTQMKNVEDHKKRFISEIQTVYRDLGLDVPTKEKLSKQVTNYIRKSFGIRCPNRTNKGYPKENHWYQY